MSKAKRERCTRRVYSGQRWDMGGHPCGNSALPGLKFCHLHDPDKKKPERMTAPAKVEPTLEARSVVTRYASATWAPGEGPIVPVPYRTSSGYVTNACVKKVGDNEPELAVAGVIAKQDGTPGQQRWTARGGRVLPAMYVRQLLEAVR